MSIERWRLEQERWTLEAARATAVRLVGVRTRTKHVEILRELIDSVRERTYEDLKYLQLGRKPR